MTECCKIPDLTDEKDINEIIEATAKSIDPKKEPNLFGCVVNQKFFEKMKLVDKKNEIDKAACHKFIQEKIKDAGFRDIAAKGIDTCLDDLKENGNEYQKYTEIPKEKCDIKFDYFTDCINLDMFMVNFQIKKSLNFNCVSALEMS